MAFVGPTPLEVQLQQQRMLMGLIQTFAEMRQRKRREELGLQQQDFENQMAERQFAEEQNRNKSLSDYYRSLAESRQDRTPEQIEAEETAKARGRVAGGMGPRPTVPRVEKTPQQIEEEEAARARGTIRGGGGKTPPAPKADPAIKRKESYGKELRAINRYYDGLMSRVIPGQPTDTIEAARKKQIDQLNKDYADILGEQSTEPAMPSLWDKMMAGRGAVGSGEKYRVGQTIEKDGAVWEYIGNDKWRKKKS